MARKITIIDRYGFDPGKKREFSLFQERVSAGFPSPADDYVEKKLDLNEYLVENPSATFFVRVEGDSMINAGIHSGDILVVDRSLKPANNRIVIFMVNGELTVKRLCRKKGIFYLVPENEAFDEIELNDSMDCQSWGVVTGVIRKI
ncbi:MAG: translesion error-prone DNA polymerase V autoproteolytic subunit [Candidatus Omnitrophica bacterium]|nr:translesion error-prone DNA polymerase V autoproteolytic subunit [Candidatus Omnitrophota bacterium]